MAVAHLKIAFARRGYSTSGGAEAYLKRLAQGVREAGHEAQLFTTAQWPQQAWPFGRITHLTGETPLRFADELERLRPAMECDVLMSLERVWSCDVYRAGDGVHRSWLDRRARLTGRMRRVAHALNPKHLATLRLEQALFGRRGARRVIANSHLVETEIAALYGYPAAQIDLVHNGVPVEEFLSTAEVRETERHRLGLSSDDFAVLFVGSGWERKGLRFATGAVEACGDPRLRLVVAGQGSAARYRSPVATFLGVRQDLPALYAAADLFLLPTIYDPFSNASLEALAAGLPVITTSANGFAEVMREGVDGSVIAAPDDLRALGAALLLWSDSARRAETRGARLELARHYDISVNVERTLEILLQAAASAASTSGKIRNT
ncbi:MAG: glycosyltransferase family 4 protein [Chthoniobacterales bacterium]